MRFRSALLPVLLLLLPSVAAAEERLALKGAEARWRSGVVHLEIRTETADPCLRLGRARPTGVAHNTLSVEVAVVRNQRGCRGAAASAARPADFNFPSITRTANTIALRVVQDGTEVARDTVPIRPASLR
jgi:hypothetical protein